MSSTFHRSPQAPTIQVIGRGAFLALLAASCGSAGEFDELTTTGPTVADQRFDGEYVIESIVVDGEPVPLAAAASVDIDTVDGRLVIQAGCNTLYGSFTLVTPDTDTDRGRASFTVPGTTGDADCPQEVLDQEQTIRQILSTADSWRAEGNDLTLESAGGDQLLLRG